MSGTTAAERLVDLLEAVKQTKQDQWLGRCPSHDDGNPSLSVTANNGRALVHCFAGCDARDVVAALGLGMADLFDNPRELTYDYPNGRQVVRSYRADGKKQISQRNTDKPVALYRLSKVQEAVQAGRDVYLAEGEEDVRTLEAMRVTGTTAPMGAGSWQKADYSPLQGGRVWIVADRDEAGMKRARGLAEYLPTVGVDVRGVLVAAHGNDVTDHRAAGGTLADLVQVDLGSDVTCVTGGKDLPSAAVQEPADGSTVSTVPAVHLRGVLTELRAWLGRFICVVDEHDLDLLTLWAAHTHVAEQTYTTPRLVIDSIMPGSGKTTVLEHLQRFALKPVLTANISSAALLPRMLDTEMRTLLIDEADRALDPKDPIAKDVLAITNSGYKRGASRPVLVPTKGGGWEAAEMSTFAPVAMAGNSPNLPDDTRSRCIRMLLMPDLHGVAEPSDWEDLEEDAEAIARDLRHALDDARDAVAAARPSLPEGCVGRMREKWNPLARVALVAGGDWPEIVRTLIERDQEEIAMEKAEGLLNEPPAMVLMRDLAEVWPDGTEFMPTRDLVRLLIEHNPGYWGELSAYGRSLTEQRMGRLLVQSAKIRSSKDHADVRGYTRTALARAWRRLKITPRNEPSEPSESSNRREGGTA